MLSSGVVDSFLASVGITARDTPEEFDQAVRDLERHWAAGGSVRSFIARYTSPRSPFAARAALERKRRPSWLNDIEDVISNMPRW